MTRFEILNGVAARQGDWAADLSRQQQHLLVVLVLAGGAVVSRERLEEVLWDFRTPYPEHGVERVASELRRELRRAAPDGDPVPARDGGYCLPVTQEQADVLRFRAMSVQARRSQGTESLELMRQALREWGPQAAGLHGGHPLRGLRGQWADNTRHTLRTEYRDAVIHYLVHAMDQHNYELALGECELRAVGDPRALLDTEFVEVWMRAACDAGNPARVQEVYRRAATAASRTGEPLGIAPPRLATPPRRDDRKPAMEHEVVETAPEEEGESATTIRGTVDVDEVNGVAVAVDTDRAAGHIEGDARARNVGPGGELIGVKLRREN